VRADRLIALVLLLQARGRMTAQELAGRLEVSVRTIYRDLDALSAAGVPVYAESGPGGGVALPEDYHVNLSALRPEEARAVFLGGLGAPLADLGAGAVLESALRKLAAVLPEATRSAAEHARQRLLVDTASWWGAPPEAPPHLRMLEDAVWSGRQLRITYGRYGRPPEVRVLDPYGLVVKVGTWYLVAAPVIDTHSAPPDATGDQVTAGAQGGVNGTKSEDAGKLTEPRVYRVSRVQAAEVLDAPSRRPPGFDLTAFWNGHGAAFLASRPRLMVTVRGRPAALRSLARGAGAGGVTERIAADAAGRITAEVDLETEEIALSQLLALGPEIEVLAPATLRTLVAQRAAETAAQYDEAPIRSGAASG
jgi:predicted DNA-binding transcriptional regulator YafY